MQTKTPSRCDELICNAVNVVVAVDDKCNSISSFLFEKDFNKKSNDQSNKFNSNIEISRTNIGIEFNYVTN